MTRTDVLNWLIREFKYTSYLEIGVLVGQNFRSVALDSRDKIGVDPDVDLNGVIRMTSDAFFESNSDFYDLIFIDGLHLHDQVYRDILNALRFLKSGGTIVCHDINPSSEAQQRVPRVQSEWTGDCWKAWVQLRAEREDLEMSVVDTESGCGIIRILRRTAIDSPSALTWEELCRNRHAWLNLISTEEFKARYRSVEANAPLTIDSDSRGLPIFSRKKRKACVYTFVQNENVFLPIWLKYYSRYFSPEDIYIIDHQSNDGSVELCKQFYQFNHIRVENKYYDAIWKTSVASQYQKQLLGIYNFVLYADADEIIVPNHRFGDLRNFLRNFEGQCSSAVAYDIVQDLNEENAVDLNRALLAQRKYWIRNSEYDKTLLSRIALSWSAGFHHAPGEKHDDANDLYLLHLHKLDLDLCWEKHKRIAGGAFNPSQVLCFSWQYRIFSFEEFMREYFLKGDLQERDLFHDLI